MFTLDLNYMNLAIFASILVLAVVMYVFYIFKKNTTFNYVSIIAFFMSGMVMLQWNDMLSIPLFFAMILIIFED